MPFKNSISGQTTEDEWDDMKWMLALLAWLALWKCPRGCWAGTDYKHITEHIKRMVQSISGAYYRTNQELITGHRRSLLQKLITEHIKSMLHTISGELYRAYQQHA
jgi:hypothetical protein